MRDRRRRNRIGTGRQEGCLGRSGSAQQAPPSTPATCMFWQARHSREVYAQTCERERGEGAPVTTPGPTRHASGNVGGCCKRLTPHTSQSHTITMPGRSPLSLELQGMCGMPSFHCNFPKPGLPLSQPSWPHQCHITRPPCVLILLLLQLERS